MQTLKKLQKLSRRVRLNSKQCFVSINAVRICLTRHLWSVIVTGSEPDVPVRRHVNGNDRALVESGG